MAYSGQVSRRFITVAETALFAHQAQDVWDEMPALRRDGVVEAAIRNQPVHEHFGIDELAEREAFVDFIAQNPEAGDVIPETGGVRKIRWARAGTGKRGGARVIYFYHDRDRPLYLLMVYAKARRENLTPEEKKAVRKLAALLKG
jgi:RelE toxin of RelEB toxin-antitoxin system